MKQRLKRFLFGLLGKDPEAVIVCFLSGDAQLAARMCAEMRELVPGRTQFTVGLDKSADVTVTPGSAWSMYRRLRRAFRHYRVALAPVLFDADPRFKSFRLAAFLFAPRKVLAYNARLERHHLRLQTALASWLFLRGVPVDRIYLRPRWLTPWRKRRDERATPVLHGGRRFTPGRTRVLVLTPYLPYPLAHGGTVRMYNLLHEAAREVDILLFAFTEGGRQEELGPLLEFCSVIALMPKREHREPRWSTLRPPETFDYDSPAIRRALAGICREFLPDLRQVEYTALAGLGGDILVEHDVTFDLYRQVYEQRRTFSAWWDWWRWRRFEKRAIRQFHRVVVMSDKDADLLAGGVVIPNGVDLQRFQPEPERAGARVLFIGSFRHFPNVIAYRFFTEQVWPKVRARFPDAILTAVAGPEAELYWSAPPPEGVRLLGFVRDVRPLYLDANVVVVPTLVSAGTNLKVIEAMAMERAVVSTTSGCAGLGLEHGTSVWVADGASKFADGVAALLADAGLRGHLAWNARRIAEERYDWKRLGEAQRKLYRELAGNAGMRIRSATETDVAELDRLQKSSPEAVLWEPQSYLGYDCRVAEAHGRIVGFIVVRWLTECEAEVLSLIVDPEARRRGIAGRLLENAMAGSPTSWFLEVRESNLPARNLYRKFGFQEVSARANYYQDNGETAVVMRRQS